MSYILDRNRIQQIVLGCSLKEYFIYCESVLYVLYTKNNSGVGDMILEQWLGNFVIMKNGKFISDYSI